MHPPSLTSCILHLLSSSPHPLSASDMADSLLPGLPTRVATRRVWVYLVRLQRYGLVNKRRPTARRGYALFSLAGPRGY